MGGRWDRFARRAGRWPRQARRASRPALRACGFAGGALILLAASGCAGPQALLDSPPLARGGKAEVARGVPAPELEPVDDPKYMWRLRRARLLEVHDWTAVGRLALRSGDEAFTASLQWRQRGERYRIRLSGPFGGGGVEITGGPGGVELRTADRRVYRAADAEQLLYEQVGWRVPLAGLRYWLLGRIEPDAPVERVFIDVAGRVLEFDQLGWHIRYLDYLEVGDLAMPRKASLENAQLSASVLVTRWQLGA